MNEELIKQCARETVGRFTWPHVATAGKAEVAAIDAIMRYHARAFAPLQQLAADNLKLANDAVAVLRECEADRLRLKGELTELRAHVAPLVEAIEYMIEHNGIECIPDTEAQNRISKALAPFQQEAK